MGEEDHLKFMSDPPASVDHHQKKRKQRARPWTDMKNDDDDDEISVFSWSSSSSMKNSSITCSSSSDTVDDASSCLSSSASTISNGPLYELSELMAQLPIKRGLSKHFEGKSQSFTCVLGVENIEQFAKKEGHCRKRMRACSKSYGGGGLADSSRPTVSKKVSRNSALCFAGCRPPVFPAP